MAACAPISPGVAAEPHLRLLDGFELSLHGSTLEIPPGTQRLLAFLALSPGPRPRGSVAGVLWPEVPEEQAGAALRSALWRIRRLEPELLSVSPTQLRLAADVTVDAVEQRDVTDRLIRPSVEMARGDLEELSVGGTLLPGWYDDWVVVERERLYQLQLHGLEALADRLLAVQAHGAAVEAALQAVRLDPLRESPHRMLIRIHLAECNVGEALRCFELFRRRLDAELGVAPSARLTALVQPHLAVAQRRRVEANHRDAPATFR